MNQNTKPQVGVLSDEDIDALCKAVETTERGKIALAFARAIEAEVLRRSASGASQQAAPEPVAWLWTGRGHVQAFTSKPPPSMLADPMCQPLYLSPVAAQGAEPLCACKDRPASKCPGEWEPGCDLGANEKFVRVGAQGAEPKT